MAEQKYGSLTPMYSPGPAYKEVRPDFADPRLWAGLPLAEVIHAV